MTTNRVFLTPEILEACIKFRAENNSWGLMSEKIGISEDVLKRPLREVGFDMSPLQVSSSTHMWPLAKKMQLKALWHQEPSLTASQIGAKMGISKHAVCGMRKRMGLPTRTIDYKNQHGGKRANSGPPTIHGRYVGRKRSRSVPTLAELGV